MRCMRGQEGVPQSLHPFPHPSRRKAMEGASGAARTLPARSQRWPRERAGQPVARFCPTRDTRLLVRCGGLLEVDYLRSAVFDVEDHITGFGFLRVTVLEQGGNRHEHGDVDFELLG